MKQVKQQIIKDLLVILHEANMADSTDYDGYVNDLDNLSARQDNLYGAITDALEILGAYDQIEGYIQTGSPEDALTFTQDHA